MQLGFGAAFGEPKASSLHISLSLRDVPKGSGCEFGSLQDTEGELGRVRKKQGELVDRKDQHWACEEMALAQAVLGGRGLHLQCYPTSSWSTRSLKNVRHLSTAAPLSLGSTNVSQESKGYSHLIRASGASEKNGRTKSRGEMKLLSVAALPILATIVVTQATDVYNDSVFITTYNDWMMPEKTIKDLYMLIAMVFCWGCCVFGSMNDPFYEGDEYRNAGGNGTNHWMYDMEELEEEEAREELFREALAKEIEGKVGELRELEGADKEKELV